MDAPPLSKGLRQRPEHASRSTSKVESVNQRIPRYSEVNGAAGRSGVSVPQHRRFTDERWAASLAGSQSRPDLSAHRGCLSLRQVYCLGPLQAVRKYTDSPDHIRGYESRIEINGLDIEFFFGGNREGEERARFRPKNRPRTVLFFCPKAVTGNPIPVTGTARHSLTHTLLRETCGQDRSYQGSSEHSTGGNVVNSGGGQVRPVEIITGIITGCSPPNGARFSDPRPENRTVKGGIE